jgi:hypothetical protein
VHTLRYVAVNNILWNYDSLMGREGLSLQQMSSSSHPWGAQKCSQRLSQTSRSSDLPIAWHKNFQHGWFKLTRVFRVSLQIHQKFNSWLLWASSVTPWPSS